MKSFTNYLVVFFLMIFFILRLVVVYTTTAGIDFLVVSNNVENEMIFLFIMFFSIVLIIKSKIIGAIVLFISTLWCYGGMFYSIFNNNFIITQNSILDYISTFSIIIISFMSIIVLVAQKKQELKPVDKKTDFFYKNENYDRKIDNRADKNNYKFM